MVLSVKGPRDLFKRSPEDSQFDIYEGQRRIPSSPTAGGTGVVPIGAILAHAQDIAGCPAIPAEFQKCDGSAINDVDSPMNGENTPDLNGGEFLRGDATSGGTGGADTMAHTHTTNVSVNNHSSLAMNNHTSLNIANDTHGHNDTFATGDESSHTHSLPTANDVGLGGSSYRITGIWTGAGSAHSHSITGSVSNDTHDHGFDTNISAHSFGTNISNHSVNNPASDAASNTENRPKYYNVVWIIRIK